MASVTESTAQGLRRSLAVTLTVGAVVLAFCLACLLRAPLFYLFIAIVLGREQATREKWIGIALAGAGALVLVGVASLETGALGNILIIVNMIAYSLYLVSARDLLHRYHPLTVITWIFLFGAIMLLPFGAAPLMRELPHTTPAARYDCWRG